MYKNIILVILILFMASCSKPKPDTIPSWYTQVPVDYKNLYAVAKADTVDKAKKIAIVNIRESLSKQVNTQYDTKTYPLNDINNKILNNIKNNNIKVANKISLNRVKIEKTKRFKGEELVLISIARIDLFNKIKIISDMKINRAKQADNKALNQNAIQRYIALQSIARDWVEMASLVEYKDFLLSTYNADKEYSFLNKIKKEYYDLKNSISFYILTDGNSRIFSHSIKNAVLAQGLKVTKDSSSINSFKLLVTSKTEESQNYTFNQSKNLVKLTTFDKNKNKIAFRQHTFIGKSRKSYKEAKEQAAIHLKYKIKKLGIFDFLGFNK